ncbi:MAG TPA: type II/IV secretion system protein [Candidatus Kaiserbacteria bacterium]|nr:type II/IV secretion system protein [Candidatus Kaiserbacteria bacterium]
MSLPFDTKLEEERLKRARESEEEDVARILSEKYRIAYTDLSIQNVDSDALRLISEDVAKKTEAIAFSKKMKNVSLAVLNPNNPNLPELVRSLEDRGYHVSKFLVSKKSLEHALSRYSELSFATESKVGLFDVSEKELQHMTKDLGDLQSIRDFLKKSTEGSNVANVSRLLEYILASAFSVHASDIHLEPEKGRIRLRFRIDGMLTDIMFFDSKLYRLVDSRIKMLSGLKLNIHNRAQDGRFSVMLHGTEVEIRTSLIPNSYGESFVMRVLDPSATKVSFETLGIHPKLFARLEKEIKRPNGMLLTTGPTGSGKTTTLYSFLRKVQSPDIKIITIEDPVEYHLDGIVQTQIEGKDYTFASGLRSIVRQDPDIIMVGEIRDHETASIAIQAALTGHFVFSTLHTNNAAGTFPRFADLGIDPKEFASAITVSMAQRLVRKLKPDQRKQVTMNDEQKRLVEKILSTIEDKSLLPESTDKIWIPENVSDTDNGYHGRVGLYEAVFMDDELGSFLRDSPSESDIAKKALSQGYLTMAQDGILKAISGDTSLDEVLRVVDVSRV